MRFLFYQTYIGLAKLLVRLLLFTCKVEIQGLETLIQTASQQRTILTLWHNRLLIIPEVLLKNAPQFTYRAVVSKSRDGEILARLVESYKIGRTLRVPHNGRYQALVEMINQLKQGNEILVVTPDGPRGPRYKIKPGVVLASKKSDSVIIPVSWSATACWQLRTWDRFIIPKPFSKIYLCFGKGVILPDHLEDLEQEKSYLEEILLKLDAAVCEQANFWPQ